MGGVHERAQGLGGPDLLTYRPLGAPSRQVGLRPADLHGNPVPLLQLWGTGFAERSSVRVAIELSPDIGRLAPNVEISIFRIVQECLINIHRHSGSATAAVRLSWLDGQVRLEIADNGKGISPQMRDQMESGGTVGVGVRGMRERVRQLGGSLKISSDDAGTGTRIVVHLPDTEVGQTEKAARAAG